MFFGMGAAKKKVKKKKAAKSKAAKIYAAELKAKKAKTAYKMKAAKLRASREIKLAKIERDKAQRLAKIRAQIAASVAEGATPETAVQSAFDYDSQTYPGSPLVTDQAQIPALMQAAQMSYGQVAEEPYMTSVEAQEVLQPEPSPAEAATYELVDTEEPSDVETQEAAGAVEAEGQLVEGEKLSEDISWGDESIESKGGGGFYGLGTVTQAGRVARRAAKKALDKGAPPAKAVAIAARVVRNFFAQGRRGERAARFL